MNDPKNPPTTSFAAPTEVIEGLPVLSLAVYPEASPKQTQEYIGPDGETNPPYDLLVLCKPYGTSRWLIVGIMSEEDLIERLLPGDPGYDYAVVRLSEPTSLMTPQVRDTTDLRLLPMIQRAELPETILRSPSNSDTYNAAASAAFDFMRVAGVDTSDSAAKIVPTDDAVGGMIQTLIMYGYERGIFDLYTGRISIPTARTDLEIP